jgi:hypothetical protein
MRTPCYGIALGNIPPFQGTSPLFNFGVLAFMPIAALISGTLFESKLRIIDAQSR